MAREPIGFPRARIILKQERHRRFDPFDRFAELKSERPLKDLLEEFDHLRSGNVATLRGWNLKEKDMELMGEHPEFGAVTMRQCSPRGWCTISRTSLR